jgi:hypothetical protein
MLKQQHSRDIDDACAHVFAAAKSYYHAASISGRPTIHPSLLMVFEEKVPRGNDTGRVQLIDVGEAMASGESKERLAVYIEMLAQHNALVVLVSEAWVVMERRMRGAERPPPLPKGSLERHPQRKETLLMHFAFGNGARALAHALIARDAQGKVTLSNPMMVEGDEQEGRFAGGVPPGATVH